MTITFGKKSKPIIEANVEMEDENMDLKESIEHFMDKYGVWIELGLLGVCLYNVGKVVAYTDIAKQFYRRG